MARCDREGVGRVRQRRKLPVTRGPGLGDSHSRKYGSTAPVKGRKLGTFQQGHLVQVPLCGLHVTWFSECGTLLEWPACHLANSLGQCGGSVHVSVKGPGQECPSYSSGTAVPLSSSPPALWSAF